MGRKCNDSRHCWRSFWRFVCLLCFLIWGIDIRMRETPSTWPLHASSRRTKYLRWRGECRCHRYHGRWRFSLHIFVVILQDLQHPQCLSDRICTVSSDAIGWWRQADTDVFFETVGCVRQALVAFLGCQTCIHEQLKGYLGISRRACLPHS